jgi:hypothetical protein
MSDTDSATTNALSPQGKLICGQERITTQDALRQTGMSQSETKRLAIHMRSLGWQGPKSMRFTDTSGKVSSLAGYWRLPHLPAMPKSGIEGTIAPIEDQLPAMLEAFTGESLVFLRKLVRYGFHPDMNQLTRSQVTAALGGISAQPPVEDVRYEQPSDQSAEHEATEALTVIEHTPES